MKHFGSVFDEALKAARQQKEKERSEAEAKRATEQEALDAKTAKVKGLVTATLDRAAAQLKDKPISIVTDKIGDLKQLSSGVIWKISFYIQVDVFGPMKTAYIFALTQDKRVTCRAIEWIHETKHATGNILFDCIDDDLTTEMVEDIIEGAIHQAAPHVH